MYCFFAPLANAIKTTWAKPASRFPVVVPEEMPAYGSFYQPSGFRAVGITALAFIVYAAVSVAFHDQLGIGIAALAVIPVICGGWYFGTKGGVLVVIPSILVNAILLVITDQPQNASILDLSNILRIFILLLIALVVGKLGSITREREKTLRQLKQDEKTRRAHTKFLELLNGITGSALEADNLDSTLAILVEKIGKLFEADDCFFSLWDADRGAPVPTVAYGSMSDIYPYMQFEPGELTLSASVMKIGHPVAVANTENSPYIDQRVALVFPSRSMLGLPLMAQERRIGTLLLGYNQRRSFDQNIMTHAGITAEQVALVLSKSLLLEEERKQVKQLTALHEVARVATQADNEDTLIELVTDIIGKNLFPDNFGILLLDDQNEFLRPHPSYRFFSNHRIALSSVKVGDGVTGKVAQTRQPQRIGNVRRLNYYLDVDNRTISELCVPILFKDRLLGVINAESTRRNAFNTDDERLLATLAGQLATAIEQIRRAQAERKWLDQLAHSNELTYSLAHITTCIERALDKEEIMETLGIELQKIGLVCATAFYDSQRQLFTFHNTTMSPPALERFERFIHSQFVNFTFSFENLKAILKVEDICQPAVVEEPLNEIQIFFSKRREKGVQNILDEIGIDSATELLRLPLLFEKNLLGILWVWGLGIAGTDLPVMSIFAKQIGISLERARLFREVQDLAITDPLTGLNNRRSLFELGKIELSRAIRMGRPFCCMMLDLDHFKQINDNHGHLIGDQVLQEFALRCKNSVREVDLIGRYGGEEIIVLLPETDRNTAGQVAERLRKRVADTHMLVSNLEISVTVSIGVSGNDENTCDLETLIARADQAMYIAKHKGRNRVAVSV